MGNSAPSKEGEPGLRAMEAWGAAGHRGVHGCGFWSERGPSVMPAAQQKGCCHRCPGGGRVGVRRLIAPCPQVSYLAGQTCWTAYLPSVAVMTEWVLPDTSSISLSGKLVSSRQVFRAGRQFRDQSVPIPLFSWKKIWIPDGLCVVLLNSPGYPGHKWHRKPWIQLAVSFPTCNREIVWSTV